MWALRGLNKDMAEHKSSIHFAPAKGGSEKHNNRDTKLNYVHSELSKNNESYSEKSISQMKQDALNLRKQKVAELREQGKNVRLRKATYIHEAVVNIKSTTTMEELKNFTDQLEEKHKLKTFQIHIHRDEGKIEKDGTVKVNNHAHILVNLQDPKDGKVRKIRDKEMSQIQDLTAEALGMKRGKSKVNTKREHLPAMDFKIQQDIKKKREKLRGLDLEKAFILRGSKEKRKSIKLEQEQFLNSLLEETPEVLEKLLIQEEWLLREEERKLAESKWNKPISLLKTETDMPERNYNREIKKGIDLL